MRRSMLHSNTRPPIPSIFYGGLLAGTLDILSAIVVYQFIMNKTTAVKILQFIASGILGSQAFTGGNSAALLGLGLHFLIATMFSAFYYLLFIFLPVIRKQWFLSGVIYGVFVWAVMNLLVLPLTFSQSPSFQLKSTAISMGIPVVAVGIPISYLVRKRSSSNETLL